MGIFGDTDEDIKKERREAQELERQRKEHEEKVRARADEEKEKIKQARLTTDSADFAAHAALTEKENKLEEEKAKAAQKQPGGLWG
ncbi:MAG: hypothetical protein GC129_06085 [Proteobacteria bacterium]|nr:hypothetical protein [Pseudomonadota bacterium]